MKVVFSDEQPAVAQTPPGSVSFVPSVAGLLIAGEVVKDIAGVNCRASLSADSKEGGTEFCR